MSQSLGKLDKMTFTLGVILLLAGLTWSGLAKRQPSGGSAAASPATAKQDCGFPPCGAKAQEDPNGHFESAISPYVDVHAHFSAKYITDKALDNPERAVELTIEAMDAENATKFIMLPSPYAPGDPAAKDDESFMAFVKKHQDRLAFQGGGGTLNPMIQEAVLTHEAGPEVQRKFRQRAEQIVRDGAAAFGEMTALHPPSQAVPPGSEPYAFMYAPADHPLYLLLADIAAEHDLPIALHSSFPKSRTLADFLKFAPPNLHMTEIPDPIEPIERLADHNPHAKIVWEHSSGEPQRSPDVCRRLFRAHPNLYMSIENDAAPPADDKILTNPGGNALNGDIKPEWLALFREFPDRFVIGTDTQYGLRPQLTGPQSMRWRGATHFLNRLPTDLRQKIGMENAVRIYPKAHWTSKGVTKGASSMLTDKPKGVTDDSINRYTPV